MKRVLLCSALLLATSTLVRPEVSDAGSLASGSLSGDASAVIRDAPQGQDWLAQLVGDWDIRATMPMVSEASTGTDRVRAIGDHWVVAETACTMMGVPFRGNLSIGYDAHKERFHATWVDSMGGHLWVYEGTLNEARDALTLRTEGPGMEGPDTTVKYEEVMRITGKDTRTFTSSLQGEDGTWTEILTIEYRRNGSAGGETQDPEAPNASEGAIPVQYLEIVTTEVDATCSTLARVHQVTFSEPEAGFGGARTAALVGGGQIGVRAPMAAHEEPVVRTYVLVEDIEASIKEAEAAGAEFAMRATEIPGSGKFAIYFLGGIQHGFWER